MTESELREICLTDLPLNFFRQITDGIERIYQEADALAYNTPTWSEIQGEYIEPHLRLILFENLLFQSATNSQMIAISKPNITKNYSYTMIRSHRLILTANSVDGKNEIPRKSVYRRQLAEVNAFLTQPTIQFTLFNDKPIYPIELYQPNEIYGVILHGKSYIKLDNGQWIKDEGKNAFIRLAFMDKEMKQFAANFDFRELYTEAVARYDSIQSQIEDKAVPTLKRQERKEKIK